MKTTTTFWGSLALLLATPGVQADIFNINTELRNYACQYRLREQTESKTVGVNSSGYVIRGVTDASANWLIFPAQQSSGSDLVRPGASNQKVRFMTQDRHEFMSVTGPGGVVRWANNPNDPGQLFQFVNVLAVWSPTDLARGVTPLLSLMEGTRNEFLSSSPGGNLRRWSFSGLNDQAFVLERTNCKGWPTSVPISKNPMTNLPVAPGGIPSPDAEQPLNGLDVTGPEKLTPYVVDTAILSFLVVQDDRYSDKYFQFTQSPFYTLVHKQYYDRGNTRGGYQKIPPQGLSTSWTFSVQNGFSAQSLSTISHTVGWEISGGIKGTIEGGKGDCKDQSKCIKGGAEINLEGKYSDTLTTMQSSGQMTTVLQTETVSNTVSGIGTPWTIVAWSLVDQFELQDYNGTVIQSWEHVNRSSRVYQWYPKNVPAPQPK